ncbi:MAG TPA: alpha-glucuronidase family glycosyl hydrolase, partial [Gemmatimonadaceae bacterium]
MTGSHGFRAELPATPMERRPLRWSPIRALLLPCALMALMGSSTIAGPAAESGYDLWLRYRPIDDAALVRQYRAEASYVVSEGDSPQLNAARIELIRGLGGLLGTDIHTETSMTRDGGIVAGTPASSPLIAALGLGNDLLRVGGEGFVLRATRVNGKQAIVIAANSDVGVLYGAFALLRQVQTHRNLRTLTAVDAPKFRLRLLDHWDNLNGSIERGYAGPSIWQWSQLPDTISPRYKDYARADASIGINGAVLTNVNADPRMLTAEYIAKEAALANVFRPYGIKVYLTAYWAAPIRIGGLKTADPLDPAVREWWQKKVDEIYAAIPDFGGFLVKANSEGQPGPQDYHRTHADGANMLADAVGPHGGVVMWRAFVYSTEVSADRVMQAYQEFKPLDGQFHSNVLIQVKNGPLDFQPREPFSPLFGAMPETPLMMEVQITKEYLGQASHVMYLAPMWKEVLDADIYAKGKGSTVARAIDGTLFHYAYTGMAGVSNVGSDSDWTGSQFNQSNWYAFGRLAWNPDLTSAEIADEWLRMTFTNNPTFVAKAKSIMLESREAAVNYMTPLGLAHQMSRGTHFGPGPWVTGGRADQTSVYFNRADSVGLGFDRTPTGTNAVEQYFEPLRREFADIDSTPQINLLWFHHVPWNYRMKSGRTMWNELLRHYQLGVDTVRAMQRRWDSLKGLIDDARFDDVKANLVTQEHEAEWWRNASVLYWQSFNHLPLPAGYPKPGHTLDFYEHLRCPPNPR